MKNALDNRVGMLGDMFLWLVANLKQGVIYFIKQALTPNISAGSVHFFSELGGFCNYNSQKKGKEKNVTHQSPQSQRLRKAKMRISKNYHEFIVSHKGNKDSNILSISSKFRVDLPLL